jgi:hypothetical protein
LVKLTDCDFEVNLRDLEAAGFLMPCSSCVSLTTSAYLVAAGKTFCPDSNKGALASNSEAARRL